MQAWATLRWGYAAWTRLTPQMTFAPRAVTSVALHTVADGAARLLVVGLQGGEVSVWDLGSNRWGHAHVPPL